MNIRFPQRWQQISEDDYAEMAADIRSSVSTWTENTMEDGKVPALDGFCTEFPEWDNSELYDIIEAELVRIREIVERERLEALVYGPDEEDEISEYSCW